MSDRRIALGVTGGIAAYKAAELVSLCVKNAIKPRVVMTANARKFVAPVTFETLSGQRVYTDTFERAEEIEHIALAKEAELFVVAPATANFLGKLACGIADDILTTAAMATPAPILVAPAMNAGMWRAPATRHNVSVLQSRNVLFVGPETGRLACGDSDTGRMAQPETILARILEMLNRTRDFAGRRVLVTAGPTRERIDPVRYLTNDSSGKMGYAIAEAARARGAMVTLVTGHTALPAPANVNVVPVESTQDMFDAVMANARASDVCVMAAAPADYTPIARSEQKLRREGDLSIALRATPDIAKRFGEEKRAGQVLVAFAAETGNRVDSARAKLERKNADMVVLNDVTEPGAGFNVDTNRVTFVTKDAAESLPLMTKRALADEILDRVLAFLGV